MTDKEKVIKELKETLDSLDITNKYRLNVIRAIEYLQKEPVSEDLMAKAVDVTIGLSYKNKDGGYTHLVDVSKPLPVGNNKIAIIFKED